MRFGTVLLRGRPASVLDRGGTLVDLDGVARRLGRDGFPAGRALVEAWEARDARVRAVVDAAAGDDGSWLPTVDPATACWLPVIPDSRQILAVGLNYLSHCREQGKEAPDTPLFFAKLPSSLSAHGAPIPAWPVTAELDFEGELAVVIGKGGRGIPVDRALEHCFGYTVCNDVTARDLQRNDRQWTRAKGLDGFAPLGPIVVTRDEAPDPQALRVRTWVNGDLRQDAGTAEMTFPVASLVAIASQAITLAPGDVITTGTPAGVGVFAKPPSFLKPGDVIRIEIEGIGILENPVAAP